jgi:hypothetical protein
MGLIDRRQAQVDDLVRVPERPLHGFELSSPMVPMLCSHCASVRETISMTRAGVVVHC